jgi:2,3-dihydroxyphenylpropionate 1,2-dioxygenase
MQGRAINSSVAASRIIGGALLTHAPQFFTMPETEDPTRRANADYGGRNRRQIEGFGARSLDHLFERPSDQFFHQAAPPFTIHVGDAA